jgi:parallel beta-helix repeat protein
MPYDPTDYTSWPSEAAWVDALSRRTRGVYGIDCSTPEGLEAARQHLANGNLAITRFVTYQTWRNQYPSDAIGINNAVYYCPDGAEVGAHGVAVIGYDDNRPYVDHRDGLTHHGAFLVANSWGPYWGMHNSTGTGLWGFFWVAYAMFKEGTFGGPYGAKGASHIYYTDDRPLYRPTVYAVAGINHSQRGDLRLLSGVGSPAWPQGLSQAAIAGDGGTRLPLSDSKRIAVDMTDLLSLIPADGAANLFVELGVDATAASSGTIASADFLTDFNHDGAYSVLHSSDPTVTVTVGYSGYACAVASGASPRFVDDSNAAGPWDGSWDHPFSTIEAALAASAPGDLIAVAPGAYRESVSVNHDCRVQGSGAERTVIMPTSAGPAFTLSGGADVTLSNLAVDAAGVSGAIGVNCEGATVNIVQSEIRNCTRGISASAVDSIVDASQTTIRNCPLGLYAGLGTTSVGRCTFDSNAVGVRIAAPATIANSIISGSASAGLFVESGASVPPPAIGYCDVWGNATDYLNCSPGQGCISSDPRYFDPVEGRYWLGYGSPCVNAGTTDGVNPDGSTDLGAYSALTVAPAGADFAELQPALDAVPPGATASVLVSPGVYSDPRGYLVFRGPIALLGQSPSLVTLDGAGCYDSVVYVEDGAAGGAISGFTIANGPYGAGVSVTLHSPDGSPATFLIRNNIVRDNAYGILVHDDSSALVVNNTLVGNSCIGVSVESDCSSFAHPLLENNIVVSNGGCGLSNDAGTGTTCWADYNDVYGNDWDDYYRLTPGSHSLAADPLFADALTDDYHLRYPSPCIDAGDPASGYSQEPAPNGSRVNLGAYGNTPEAQLSGPFSDVPRTHWAYSEIQACFVAGIVTGYPDGTYRPTRSVSRDQMAAYISRALVGSDANVPPGPSEPSFSDVPNTGYGPDGTDPYWAYKYIEFVHANSIALGYSDGTYRPTDTVNRGQMAAYIARSIVTPHGDAGLAGYTPPTTPTFIDVPSSHPYYKYIEYVAQDSVNVTRGYSDGTYHPEYVCNRAMMAVYIQRAFQLPI